MFRKNYRLPLSDIVNKHQEAGTTPYQKNDVVSILNRFLKTELLDEVTKIVPIPKRGHAKRLDKKSIVDTIFHIIKESENFRILRHRIELKFFQLHSSRRIWYSAEVKHAKLFIEQDTIPQKFARRLEKHLLKSKFFCNAFSDFSDGMMWTLLAISNYQQKPQMAVIVSKHNSPAFLFSGLRKTQHEQVFRALAEVFDGTVTKQLPFQSTNMQTVFHNLAKYLKIDVLLPEPEPMDISEGSDSQCAENIVNENRDEDNARKAYINEVFGQTKLPALEILSYNAVSEFHCEGDENSDFEATIHVAFKGSNVLEGMRKCLYMGAAVYPLPDYISKVGIKYGNYMTIKSSKTST